MSAPYTLRVRSQVGTWRVANISPNETFGELKERLQKEHDAHFRSQGFAVDPARKQLLSDDVTIAEAKLSNGHLLFADVDEFKVGAHEAHSGKKLISKDGHIMVQDADTAISNLGFRPGMLPLRSMKMQWTLKEFVNLDEQFVYKMKAQEKSFCPLASLNSSAIQEFQNYMRQFNFHIIRFVFFVSFFY
jgi:nuclear protein localization family protein 4